jgi:hypothetical protein
MAITGWHREPPEAGKASSHALEPAPGEVFNAARAIDRTLRAAGADWHDLAGRLAATKTSHRSRNDRADTGWRAMREFCIERSNRLRSRELEFVTGLSKWRGDLTEKQNQWLTAIYERLRDAE